MRWLTFHQCSSEWAGELIILAIANQLRGAKCLKCLAFCREILRCDHSQITSDPFSKNMICSWKQELALPSAFIQHSNKNGKGSFYFHWTGVFRRMRRGGSGSKVSAAMMKTENRNARKNITFIAKTLNLGSELQLMQCKLLYAE